MLLKCFEESNMTIGLRALAERLTPNHPLHEEIKQKLQQAEAGEYGEQYIVKQLEKWSYSMGFHVLHNVALLRPVQVQLDVVIVTPHEVIIVESKNIRGEVQLTNKPRQMIRVLDTGERRIFHHPEVQVEEYVYGLQAFFRQHGVEVCVDGVIVFPFNNASIEYTDGMFPVVMARELGSYLRNRPERSVRLDVQRITALLLRHHQPYEPFPLCRYYGIEVSDILPGVICPKCQHRPMQRLPFMWSCSQCHYQDNTSHQQTILDYRMLISDTVDTKSMQNFLATADRHTVKRILQANAKGTLRSNRHMIYKL